MPTAATADAASCCVIERNPEQSRFQLRTCLRRSRRAGPVHLDASAHLMAASGSRWVATSHTARSLVLVAGDDTPSSSTAVSSTLRPLAKDLTHLSNSTAPLRSL